MIFFIPGGRLGNQCFQFSYIDSIRQKDEKLITMHCEYFNIFDYDNKNIIFLPKIKNKFFLKLFYKFINILKKLRLVTVIKQDIGIYKCGLKSEINSISIKKGLFPSIKIVEGFFQSENYIGKLPKFKQVIIEKGSNIINSIDDNYKKIFVHVRYGDYFTHTICGKKGTVLPVVYYNRCIEYFNQKYKKPLFIFMSDDVNLVKQHFSHINNKLISNNSVGVDLFLMSKCLAGIMSCSTLSYWGGMLMKDKDKLFAPKYWLGFKSKVWIPDGIQTSFIEYIDVLQLGDINE